MSELRSVDYSNEPLYSYSGWGSSYAGSSSSSPSPQVTPLDMMKLVVDGILTPPLFYESMPVSIKAVMDEMANQTLSNSFLQLETPVQTALIQALVQAAENPPASKPTSSAGKPATTAVKAATTAGKAATASRNTASSAQTGIKQNAASAVHSSASWSKMLLAILICGGLASACYYFMK